MQVPCFGEFLVVLERWSKHSAICMQTLPLGPESSSRTILFANKDIASGSVAVSGFYFL